MDDAVRRSNAKEGIKNAWMRLARRHYGAVSRDQLLELGVHPRAIDRLLASGILERALPGVYVASSVPPSWEQRAAAALLWAGPDAVLSHTSAARLWRLDLDHRDSVEITVSGRRTAPTRWLKVHQAQDSVPRVKIDGLRATPLGRALVDIAAQVSPEELEEAFESALRSGSTSLHKLESFVTDHCTKGRRGCAAIRRLLRQRGAIPATESRFETRLNALLRRSDLPLPNRQVEIKDGQRFIARVDFAYPAAKVAIEADSWRHHSGRRAWQRDGDKGNDLSLLGWTVLRFTFDDLTKRPDWVVDRIRRALGGRLFE